MVTRPRPRPTRRDLLRGDRGSVSVELVIATPLVLLILLGIIQFALWSHATHTAQAAASRGLSATRVHNGTTADGLSTTRRMLSQLADGPLDTTTVTVDRDQADASVQVRGHATSVIPFLRLPVHARATGPVERHTDPTGQ